MILEQMSDTISRSGCNSCLSVLPCWSIMIDDVRDGPQFLEGKIVGYFLHRGAGVCKANQ